MNLEMNKTQQKAYDRTTVQIRKAIGSYHQIALRVMFNCGKEHTGEAYRSWFAERRIPTHIVFSLYECMEERIDPLTLCPWLAEHVVLKEKTAAREA